MLGSLAVGLLFFFWGGQVAGAGVQVRFEHPVGTLYTREVSKQDFPGLLWNSSYNQDRLVIASGDEGHGNVLEAIYPPSGFGSHDSGGQFMVGLSAQQEYYLGYWLKFSPDFQFVKGGKLPGLVGGTHNTGSNRPTGDGWSARYMWRREGRLVVYLYHLDQVNDYGDDVPTGWTIPRGEWFHLVQRIRVNSADLPDGELEVWINGRQVLVRNDIRYRIAPEAEVDALYFSTFFGGSNDSWAPSETCRIWFDDLRISTDPRDIWDPPVPPDGLQARFTGRSVALAWDNVDSLSSDVEIQRKSGESGTWSTIAVLPADQGSFEDENIDLGERYFYRLAVVIRGDGQVLVRSSWVEFPSVVIDMIKGDVNYDYRVNSGDAILLLRYCAGLEALSRVQLQAANLWQEDMQEEVVDPADAVTVLQVLVDMAPTTGDY